MPLRFVSRRETSHGHAWIHVACIDRSIAPPCVLLTPCRSVWRSRLSCGIHGQRHSSKFPRPEPFPPEQEADRRLSVMTGSRREGRPVLVLHRIFVFRDGARPRVRALSDTL